MYNISPARPRLLIVLLLTLGFKMAAGQCVVPQIRVYANSQQTATASFLNLGVNGGTVTNAPLAANGVPADFSTLDGGLLGTATQFLNFAQTYHAGTAVTIKLSLPSGLLSLLGGVTIQPIITGAHTAVGAAITGTTLLGLLNGAGDQEITVSPTGDFDGVSVSITGLNIDESLNIYDAYIMQPATANAGCNTPIDVLSGVAPITPLGSLGTTLGSVSNPQNAIDADPNSYAEIDAVANVLSTVYHTTVFNSPSHRGDTIKMIVQNSGAGLLDLNVSSGFSIQLYDGITAVGSPIIYSTSSLVVKLFPLPSNKYELDISPPSDALYDRVEVMVGGVAALGLTQGLKIYNVTRVIATPVINNSSTPTTTTICEGNTTTLTVSNPQDCTTYSWYDAPTGGNLLYTGTSYTPLISSLTAGTYNYYVQASRNGCTEVSARSLATIVVNPAPTITPGALPTVCNGVTATLPYTATNTPVTYNINWDPAAITAGFTNLTNIALPANNISLTIPATAATGTYTGNITVTNSFGCISPNTPLSITVDARPTPPVIALSN